MSRIVEAHEPTPEFRDHLEWEIVRHLRINRRRSLRPSGESWRRLRTAAAIFLSLVTGATATMLSAQVQDARERDALLAAERSELQLARARVDLELNRVREIRQKADVGIVGREALAAAEAELRAMEAKLDRILLNVEEIRATARAPRDDLAAPVVGGRDFMRARLNLDLARAQQGLTAAERTFAEVRQRHSVGATPRLALLDAEVEVARAKADLESLIGKLELRQELLKNNLSATEAARREQEVEQVRQLEVAEHVHRIAEERLALLREMSDVGQVEQIDVLRLQLEVAEQAAEIQRIRRSLEVPDR